MKKSISSGYMESLNTLTQRFQKKHDTQNPLHKDLQARLNDLAGQLNAVEVIRQTRTDNHDAHALNVGRAAERLRLLAETAAEAISAKAKEAEGSFEATLRKESGLVNGPYAVEIRQRLHAMNPGERVKAVQALIEDKDGASLSAIFDAPSMLTGLNAADISTFKEQFFKVVVPELVQARDTYRDLNEHVHAAVKTSIAAASEYSDPRKLRELEEREAEAAKAQEALKGV